MALPFAAVAAPAIKIATTAARTVATTATRAAAQIARTTARMAANASRTIARGATQTARSAGRTLANAPRTMARSTGQGAVRRSLQRALQPRRQTQPERPAPDRSPPARPQPLQTQAAKSMRPTSHRPAARDHADLNLSTAPRPTAAAQTPSPTKATAAKPARGLIDALKHPLPPRQANLPGPRDVVRVFSKDGAQKGHTGEPAVVLGRRKTQGSEGSGLELDVFMRNGARERVPFTPQRVDLSQGDPVRGRVRDTTVFRAILDQSREIGTNAGREVSRAAEGRDDDQMER